MASAVSANVSNERMLSAATRHRVQLDRDIRVFLVESFSQRLIIRGAFKIDKGQLHRFLAQSRKPGATRQGENEHQRQDERTSERDRGYFFRKSIIPPLPNGPALLAGSPGRDLGPDYPNFADGLSRLSQPIRAPACAASRRTRTGGTGARTWFHQARPDTYPASSGRTSFRPARTASRSRLKYTSGRRDSSLVCMALYRSCAVKWLAETSSSGSPATSRPLPCGIAQRSPAHIGLISVFLRHDIGHILLIHRAAVQPDRHPGLAVDIAFFRAAAEPGELLKTRRDDQRHAQARERRQIAKRRDRMLHQHRAVAIDRIGNGVAEPGGMSRGLDGVDGFHLHRLRPQLGALERFQLAFQPVQPSRPATARAASSGCGSSRRPTST